MNKTTEESLKVFGLALLRHLMTLAGVWLVKTGIIDEATQGILTSEGFLIATGGLAVAGLSALWQWRRARYHVELPKAALEAEPGTPLEVVKADVKSKL